MHIFATFLIRISFPLLFTVLQSKDIQFGLAHATSSSFQGMRFLGDASEVDIFPFDPNLGECKDFLSRHFLPYLPSIRKEFVAYAFEGRFSYSSSVSKICSNMSDFSLCLFAAFFWGIVYALASVPGRAVLELDLQQDHYIFPVLLEDKLQGEDSSSVDTEKGRLSSILAVGSSNVEDLAFKCGPEFYFEILTSKPLSIDTSGTGRTEWKVG